MPGILGAVGADSSTVQALGASLRRRWPDADVRHGDGWVLGAHSFGGTSALRPIGRDRLLAIDGERSAYEEAYGLDAGKDFALPVEKGNAPTGLNSAANLVLLDPETGAVCLAADPAGVFPLFHGQIGTTFLFSSFLRPIGAILGGRVEELAILEFLRNGYTVGAKSLFRDAHRLLPGQVLHHRPGTIRTEECSRAWVGTSWDDPGTLTEATWERLARAIRRAFPDPGAALMMSGGWDSRTLLATASSLGVRPACYSHGDLGSRELRIVRRLCAAAEVPVRMEPLDDRILDLSRISIGFSRTGNVVFPHWHRAGCLLGDSGASAVASGVFGEILGGHYGPAMVAGAAGKVRWVGAPFIARESSPAGPPAAMARRALHHDRIGPHWYLDPDFEASVGSPRQRMNGAIDDALERLERRGIDDGAALIEAFITEHRGARYIGAQPLSCRAHVDIALPFAGGEVFGFATRIPLNRKVHNRLNQGVLRSYGPAFLREPMAATLVRAALPIPIQEASRAVRKMYGTARNLLHRKTRGRIAPARLSWANFDFLKTGEGLREIVEDLRLDIWNRAAIDSRIAGLEQEPDPHPVFDQLLKVYMVDQMLRRDQ